MGSIRDAIKTAMSPPWASTGVFEKYLYDFGLSLDAILDKLNQGMVAHIPTYSDASALALLAADRLIPRGINESAIGFAVRLKYAYDDWQLAGSARSILRQVLGLIAPSTPQARIVSESSVYDTYPLGADTRAIGPTHSYVGPWWVWDSLSAAMWWRFWTIVTTGSITPSGTAIRVGGVILAATNASPIQVTMSTPHGLPNGASVTIAGALGNTAANGTWTVTVVDPLNYTLNGSTGNGVYTSGGLATSSNVWTAAEGTWGDGDTWEAVDASGNTQKSWGLSVPSSQIAAMRAVIAQWKGKHAWCPWLIVSFDPNLFDPLITTNAPDRNFGTWSKPANGVMIPSRFANARYCDGTV